MDTTLGIDLGTQGLKVVFYDYKAREVVASAFAITRRLSRS
jgi:sugar (pentulose or hexulose) kinase